MDRAIQFYTTNVEQVFQEVRYVLALHPELLNAPPEQLASFVNLKSAVFEIEMALEALRLDSGEIAA